MLNFELGDHSEFLPIATQVQAARVRVISLEEADATNRAEIAIEEAKLAMVQEILSHLDEAMASGYTIGQFVDYLQQLRPKYEDSAQGENVEIVANIARNTILHFQPLTGKPVIRVKPRMLLRRGGLALGGSFVGLCLFGLAISIMKRTAEAA